MVVLLINKLRCADNGVSGSSLHCINFGAAMDPCCGTGEHHKDQLQQTEPAPLPVYLSVLLEPAAKVAGPDVPMRDQL